MFRSLSFRNYNFSLLIFTIAITVIGILAVGSAEEALQSRQMWGAIVGIVLMVVISLFDYRLLLRFYYIYYAFNLVLLFLVLFIGESGNGAQRWVRIAGIQFQPSELCKLIIIIVLAAFVGKHYEELNTFKYIVLSVILFAIPASMVYLQPDLSTTIVLVIIFATIIFVADISWKVIVGVLAVVIPIAFILFYLIMQPEQNIVSDYQKSRIMSFFNKENTENDEGYQQRYSVMAIGSGQLNGKGYKNNEIYSVKNADFIAEQQTDFILAVIGEEFGFIGTCTVVVLILLISLSCLNIGLRAPDVAGRMIGTGVGAWIGFQGFINIGVVTYILPNTGLPLPFVSYGLTSLMCNLMAIGFVLNVGLQCREK